MILKTEIEDFVAGCRANEEGLHHVRLIDALIRATALFSIIRVELLSDSVLRFSFDCESEEITLPVATARMRQLCGRLAKVVSEHVERDVNFLGDELDANVPTDKGYVAFLHVHFSNENGRYFLELKNIATRSMMLDDSQIDELIGKTVHTLITNEKIESLMATSNATGWSVDDYTIDGVEKNDDGVSVYLSFHASGEQDEDRVFAGHEITGDAVAKIENDGTVSYEIDNAAKVDESEKQTTGDVRSHPVRL